VNEQSEYVNTLIGEHHINQVEAQTTCNQGRQPSLITLCWCCCCVQADLCLSSMTCSPM
jgi:hypothetical protein